jgi:hypothetical protein
MAKPQQSVMAGDFRQRERLFGSLPDRFAIARGTSEKRLRVRATAARFGSNAILGNILRSTVSRNPALDPGGRLSRFWRKLQAVACWLS